MTLGRVPKARRLPYLLGCCGDGRSSAHLRVLADAERSACRQAYSSLTDRWLASCNRDKPLTLPAVEYQNSFPTAGVRGIGCIKGVGSVAIVCCWIRVVQILSLQYSGSH